jgi:hypothetical protein
MGGQNHELYSMVSQFSQQEVVMRPGIAVLGNKLDEL